jgi:tripartite-type tricarboxylate transporter receptor subunit TctC
MAMPKVQEQIRALGMEPYVTEPEEFLQMIRSERDKYGQLIKDIGLKLD